MPHEGRQGLTVNFRSQPAVLDFVNALLGKHLDDYEPLVAHHSQVNPGPCVEFLWSPRPKDVSVEALFVLGRHTEGMWAGLQDEASEALLPDDQFAPVRRARANLRAWRAVKDRLPIAGLLGRVFADSGFDAATQMEYLGDRKL